MARVTVNKAALMKLLKSPEVRADLVRRADNIRAAADVAANDPGGHWVDSQIGERMARAAVITATPKSMWKEAVHKTLTSSVDAGRS